MKKPSSYKILMFSLIGTVALTGCARDKIKIGKDSPQIEIQKCMELSNKKKFEEAIECLEIFKSRYAQTSYGTSAELQIADNYFNNKEYLLAADTYNAFIRMHPTSPKLDYAYYRLGSSYLEESPKAIDRDQQYLDEAIYFLRMAVVGFPSGPYYEAAMSDLKEARSRVAKRTYYIGNFYFKTGEFKSAIPRFIDLVNTFPESELVPKTLYKLVVAAGKLKKVNEAKMFYSKLSVDYPDNRWTKKSESKLENYVKKYGNTGESVAPLPPQTMPLDAEIPQ